VTRKYVTYVCAPCAKGFTGSQPIEGDPAEMFCTCGARYSVYTVDVRPLIKQPPTSRDARVLALLKRIEMRCYQRAEGCIECLHPLRGQEPESHLARCELAKLIVELEGEGGA
jgi:hypothetical protein